MCGSQAFKLLFILAASIRTSDGLSPAVGILFLQSEFDFFPQESHYGWGELIKWVSQHGLRWFPIFATDSTPVLRQKIADANLILFTGGDIEMYDPHAPAAEKKLTVYAKAVRFIVRTAQKMTDSGSPKPIYGICLGYQALVLSVTNHDVFFNDDFANVQQQQPAKFDLEKLSLFNEIFSREELEAFGRVPTFWHSYNHGFTVENALKTASFVEQLDILSTSVTLKGVHVVSAIRHKHYPFYGTLFHPEHAQFNHLESDHFPWPEKILRANRRVGNVIMRLIGSPKYVIDNDTLVRYRDGLRFSFSKHGDLYHRLDTLLAAQH